jgi:hypothetical protein
MLEMELILLKYWDSSVENRDYTAPTDLWQLSLKA